MTIVNCSIDRLRCTGKEDIRRRGTLLTRVEFKSVEGGQKKIVKRMSPGEAAQFEIGAHYSLVLTSCLDAPGSPELPALRPGDQVLHFHTWAGLRVWRPALLIRLGRASVRIRGLIDGKESNVPLRSVQPTPKPFPDLSDSSAILPGQRVVYQNRTVLVDSLHGDHEAVISRLLTEDDFWHGATSGRKLVDISELRPAPVEIAQGAI